MTLTTRFIAEEIAYTGKELRSHWALRRFGVMGDSALAFVGPCAVAPEAMVDLEDALAGAVIRGGRMLHFIIEHFSTDMALAVARQHLLAALAGEELNARLGERRFRREGDDLYDGSRKLSISIAAPSPVSALIHFAVNVTVENVPVPACGLAEYGIEAPAFAEALLGRYRDELEKMERARCKARATP